MMVDRQLAESLLRELAAKICVLQGATIVVKSM
jgi:hypothetical protein